LSGILDVVGPFAVERGILVAIKAAVRSMLNGALVPNLYVYTASRGVAPRRSTGTHEVDHCAASKNAFCPGEWTRVCALAKLIAIAIAVNPLVD